MKNMSIDKNNKIKEIFKSKKKLIVIGAILIMAIVIICLTSCGKTKLKDNPGGSNDNNNNNNIVDKNGEFIIPEDYNPTDEKCFGFEEGIIKAFYCYEGNNYGLPTVTDLVIPYKINGEWVKKINTYDPDYIDLFDNKNINSLVLPNSVINISGGEFSRNPLTKIVLSESLQAIEEGTFRLSSCQEESPCLIEELVIPASVEYISEYAFWGFDVNKLIISAKKLNSFSFEQMEINELILKDGVVNIEEYAFNWGAYYSGCDDSGCQDKTIKLDIPDTVESIGDYAFPVGLSEVSLGKNITSLGEHAFGDRIQKIYLANEEQKSQFIWKDVLGDNFLRIEYIVEE